MSTIQIRRGNQSNLPILKPGEPAFCVDTKNLMIGDGTTNTRFVKENEVLRASQSEVNTGTDNVKIVTPKTLKTLIDTKVDKVEGKQLSTNDYTTVEKQKLSGVSSNAQVNQNAFSNVKVGNVTVSADTPTDTIEIIAGTNVTITPDASLDKITISSKDTVYTHPSSHDPSIITENANKRFSSDTEKASWNAKATTQYVDNKVASLVGSAPEALDTLIELSTALGNDPNFATTVMTKIGEKADKNHNHKAAEVTFTDGKTFQQKLDDGSLRGLQGDKGETGNVGPQGPKGDPGAVGPNDISTSTTSSGFTNGHYLYNNNGKVGARALPVASTGGTGIVQLNDTITSTSVTQAATANAVKQVQDNVNTKFNISSVVALAVDLNTIVTPGVYMQTANGGATTAHNYPINEAGTLVVTPSAYGAQQEYTSFWAGRKFVRGLADVFNGSGPWSVWKEYSLTSHTHPYLPLSGGHLSGYIVNNFGSVVYGTQHTVHLLATGSDLNTITGSNVYMVASPVNGPALAHGWCYLTIYKHNDIYVHQKATDLHTGVCWNRTMAGGAWSTWYKESRDPTISTANPSGGNHGDFWCQV